MIYLASPYSDPNPAVEQARFEAVCGAAATLMGKGYRIFSPIAHTHPIAMAGELPRGWDWWKRYDEEMLAAFDELWVLMLPGWDKSKGVKGEVAIWREKTNSPCPRFIKPGFLADMPDAVAEW